MVLRRFLVARALAAVVFTGCGGSDDSDSETSATEDADESTADDSGDGSGEGSSDGAAADIGDFPIPAPPGGTDAQKIEAEGLIAYNVTISADDFESVITFYDDWTSSQSDEYARTEAQSGGVIWVRTGGAQGTVRSVLASAPGDRDTTFVSLTDQTSPG